MVSKYLANNQMNHSFELNILNMRIAYNENPCENKINQLKNVC